MMWMHHAHYMWPGLIFFGLGKLLGLLLLGLLIWGLVSLFTRQRSRPWGVFGPPANQSPQQPQQPYYTPTHQQPPYYAQPASQLTAMEILQQRYARGEIDAATFDQMRERLQGPMAPQAPQQ